MEINQLLDNYGQYKKDIFSKLDFSFQKSKTILDVGCGDGTDAAIFKHVYGLEVFLCDVYKNQNINQLGMDFQIGDILSLPYQDNTFDYIFVHDVLHHIDEINQNTELHIKALIELKRVVKLGGTVIIVEGNRYNPLFYPHMVKLQGHNHFTQKYFKALVSNVYPDVRFKFFEAHVYPKRLLWLFKFYEALMEKFLPKNILAYNVAFYQKSSK